MKRSCLFSCNVCLRVLLLAALGGSVLSAQEAAPLIGSTNGILTLETLLSAAVTNNPELKFYEAELAAARAERKSAGRLANPELNAEVGHKTVRGSGLEAEGVAWSVALLQPFEWPGRLGLRKALADREVGIAELGLDRFRQALSARLRTLAFTFVTAEEKAVVARTVAERFQALREVLVQRDTAGLTPLLETRIIEATELSTRRQATAAALTAQEARVELNQLRGLPMEAGLTMVPPQFEFETSLSTEALLALARTNNFDLRLRALELTQQGFRVDLARNDRFAAISVGPSFSQENAGDRERIVGLGISLPLPLWNRNKANIEAARARQSQAEATFAIAQREVERRVLAAAVAYEARRQEMAGWQTNSIQHFREAADLADRHYRLGAVPVSVYVELQKQYLEAVDNLIDTRQEALEAATQLELQTGLPRPLVRIIPANKQN